MRPPLLALPAFGLALWSLVAASEPNKQVIGPANQYIASGIEALRAGDHEEAIRLTRIGLARHPTRHQRTVGFNNLCYAFLSTEQYSTALEYCNESLHSDDQNWRAYHNRALVQLKRGEVDEAIDDLEKGLTINRHSAVLLRTLAAAKSQKVNTTITLHDY